MASLSTSSELSPNALIVGRHPELGSLTCEITLNIQYAEMSDGHAQESIWNCTEYLKIDDDPFVIEHAQLEFIDRQKLTRLFTEATGMRVPETRYITALKVWFGMESGRIVPIFQPVCLTWATYDIPTDNNLYSLFENGHGKYYRYRSGTIEHDFFELNEADFIASREAYRNSIKILHSDIQLNHTDFIEHTDIDCCVITFQVIYSLLHFNGNSETFRLYNSIRQVSYDDTNPVKHTMLLSCVEFDEEDKDKLMVMGKYANRSHLCPPCTNLFGYPS